MFTRPGDSGGAARGIFTSMRASDPSKCRRGYAHIWDFKGSVLRAGRLAPDIGHPRYTRSPFSSGRLALLPGIAEGELLPAPNCAGDIVPKGHKSLLVEWRLGIVIRGRERYQRGYRHPEGL